MTTEVPDCTCGHEFSMTSMFHLAGCPRQHMGRWTDDAPGLCAHCGRMPIGTSSDPQGRRLCYPMGVMPPASTRFDCLTLVTVYKHPVGCRSCMELLHRGEFYWSRPDQMEYLTKRMQWFTEEPRY